MLRVGESQVSSKWRIVPLTSSDPDSRISATEMILSISFSSSSTRYSV